MPSGLLQFASVYAWSDRGRHEESPVAAECRSTSHHRSHGRRDYITPVLCQLHWLPVRRRVNSVEFKLACLVRQTLCGKCLRTWLMMSISSPKATDDPFGLPLITCVRCHVRTTASETEALALPVCKFGTVSHVACEHLTSATNILRHY